VASVDWGVGIVATVSDPQRGAMLELGRGVGKKLLKRALVADRIKSTRLRSAIILRGSWFHCGAIAPG